KGFHEVKPFEQLSRSIFTSGDFAHSARRWSLWRKCSGPSRMKTCFDLFRKNRSCSEYVDAVLIARCRIAGANSRHASTAAVLGRKTAMGHPECRRAMYNVVKLQRAGGSLAVNLPKAMLDRLHLESGENVFIVETEDGILITPYDSTLAKQWG